MVWAKDTIFSRNELYWGDKFQEFLANKHVAVFGLGGVGGHCAEALIRAGVGKLTLVDFDTVSISNINRQIVAVNSTVGIKKTELFEKRLKDINAELKLNVIDEFYQDKFDFDGIDFVVDAIDTMKSKISLLESCFNKHIPTISSMGAGNRIDPTQLYICDLGEIENKNAPFVSNVLYQLKKRGIETGITVVVSREKPHIEEKISETEHIINNDGSETEFVKIIPASTPFVASVAGIYSAYFIISEFKKEFENG